MHVAFPASPSPMPDALMLPIAPEFASPAARQPAAAPQAATQAAAAQEAAQAAAEAGQAATQEATLADVVRLANEAAAKAMQEAEQPVAPGTPIAVDVPGMGRVPVVPMSRDEVRALDRRGSELSSQLNSAEGRRDDLVEQLSQTTDPGVRAGLEARIAVLDARLVSIEKDIAANGVAKASLEARMGMLAPEAPTSNVPEWVGPLAFFTIMPIALAAARLFWKRGNRPPVVPISPQAEARFSELEQAIDSVAIEIERVAEGQRFVTKLLREGQPLPDFTARPAAEAVPHRHNEELGR
jgi:hypothetical protein